jgi:single-strand DNA-binding protein
MSVAINKVMLAGNLTRDPEVRKLNGDKSVANFGLAINRKFKGGDGEMKEEVTFVDVEAWGRTAELVGQYLTKGRGAFIEGRLKLDSWDDKDGQKRSKLKVVADSVQFLDSGKRGDGAPADEPLPSEQAAAAPPKTPAPARADSDEPPF